MIIPFHTVMGVLALVAGAAIFLLPKGTSLHRAMGATYAGSMVLMLATSFAIFDLFGGFGPYHAMSIVSVVTLGLALYFPLFRHRHANWMIHHYMWTIWSYIGLVMATGSHFFAVGPEGWSPLARAALYWGVPPLVGYILIFTMRARAMRSAAANMRQLGVSP